jgi:hypothetical protein
MEPKVVFGAVSAFSTKTLIRLRRRMRNSERKRDVVDVHRFDCIGECGKAATLDEPLRTTLYRDLTLATEHVQSIWWLLEIARQHQQPIPGAALTNLDLTLRHLRELKKRIPIANQAPEPEIGLTARQETLLPRHPRPSF